MNNTMVLTKVINLIKNLDYAYYKLIIIVGKPGSGKTKLLKKLKTQLDVPYVNVNLELSKRLLEFPIYMRKIKTRTKMIEIIEQYDKNNIVLLDNIELLFSLDLEVEPLNLLKTLSRDRCLIVSWSGVRNGKYLIYAEPNHSEYRKELIEEIITISLD